MGTSVERLRWGLLLGAGLLVLVIAGFLGYARYRVGRTIADLPGKLGATITKEFNGYTYSQSDGKRTVFTIHAAKAMQHSDGKYTLHDVSMVLYGKTGDRADRISGEEFEYDTKAEVIRAMGVVHLDLEAPAPTGGAGSDARKHLGGASVHDTDHEVTGPGSGVIHVKTSGLVYLKQMGVAATDQSIEFAFGGFTGHAVGAEFNSDSGHLILDSAITVSGVDKGRPVAMSAAHGEFDRAANLAVFSEAHYGSAGQTAKAQIAQIHMRTDGTLERIEAERGVEIEAAGRGTATSDRANIMLDAASRPKSAVLMGSVRFTGEEPLRQIHGNSDTANLDFDARGQLDHAILQSHVRTSERQRRDERAPWQESNLTADNLDLMLVSANAGGKPVLRDAKATGSAHLTSVATVSKPAKPSVCGGEPVVSGRCFVTTTSKLSGDLILAHFIAPQGKAEVSTVHAAGHTIVEQHSSAGVDQISSGDSFDARFRQVPGAKNTDKESAELASAVQQGGVMITRSFPGKSKDGTAAPRVLQHETARMATYNADASTVTFTGDVRMSDSGSTLMADRVVMDRESKNATADGAVKMTYLASPQQSCAKASGAQSPVHILAARAELNHDEDRATFYGASEADGRGGGTGMARLWQAGTAARSGSQDAQGGSQIEAPVLIFEEQKVDDKEKSDHWRLTARAGKGGVSGQVHAVLAYIEKPKRPDASGKGAEPPHQGVARLTSSQMVYSDMDHQAVFSGEVRLLDRLGAMRAEQMTVFLTSVSAGRGDASNHQASAMNSSSQATTSTPCPNAVGASGTDTGGVGMLAGSAGDLGGGVERIVATQHVEITQPGRKATGERLVYTSSDQMFVLTGSAGAPPKVVDALQGTTTGAALRFFPDGSVVVLGKNGDAPAQKVHTETRVKQ